jgi:hypothetical protein
MKTVVTILCAGALTAVLLAKAGVIQARFITASTNADGTARIDCFGDCTGVESPLLQDVARLVVAAQSPSLDRAGAAFMQLAARARRLPPARSAALVRRRAGVVATLAAEETLLRGRVGAVPLRTDDGNVCRRAFLRLVARYKWALDRFQRNHSIRRFDVAKRQSDRSYARDVRPCLAAAPREERDAIARAMSV